MTGTALLQDGAFWRSRYRLCTLNGFGFLHSAYPAIAADAVFFERHLPLCAGSESLLTEVVRPRPRVVDIGCGAGAGGMVIARAWPDLDITLLDINPEALRLTCLP